MIIKGKYFPVGHGLTYGFKLENFNLLFDVVKKKSLIKDVEKFFGSTKVDTLILSHFHDDHTDGINDLITAGFKINRVYIPYIDDDEKFILRLRKYFSSALKSTDILTNENDLSNNPDYDIVRVSGSTAFKIDNFWEFSIFQSKGNASTILSLIISKLNRIGIYTKGDVLNKLISNYDDIKKAYDTSIRDLNLTSIYLIHGPLNKSDISECNYNGQQYIPLSLKSGSTDKYYSLITGDSNLDLNKTEISKYSDMLGIGLVPHHSGLKEWSDFLCKSNQDLIWIVTISIIGSRPNGLIVKDIYTNYNVLFICDNYNSFEYFYIV